MTIARTKYLMLLSVCLAAVVACDDDGGSNGDGDDTGHTTAGTATGGAGSGQVVKEAEVDLEAAVGKTIDGDAELTATDAGVKIRVEVEDAPSGTKGVHIHEKGDCSDIAGKSMGDHFAPEGHDHGLPAEGQRHLGDLGNIEVGENGKGTLEITVAGANLIEGDENSFLGRALVIHEETDKGSAEQPSGASGTPMACGVVERD